ncbi:MAG: DUF547 domain-containing protein, partial [Vicinamibacteria bacterium]
FDAVLHKYNHAGLIDYGALKRDRGALDSYLASLASLSAKALERAPMGEAIAFYLNAYNAIMIDIVLRHYPIEKKTFLSFYPAQSVRQIDGVFDGIRTRVAGRELTLDDIEHRCLRREFKEPRIHFALVCAARGCPALAQEAYRGAVLGEQLDSAASRFFRDRSKNRFDEASRRVEVSSILRWYGDDFRGAKGLAPFRSYPEPEASILSIFAAFDPEFAAAAAVSGVAGNEPPSPLRPWKVEYLDYDWTLNDYAPSEAK